MSCTRCARRGQRLVAVTDMLAEASIARGRPGSRSTGTSATSRCSGRASTRKWSTACAAAARTPDRLSAARQAGVLDRQHDPGRKRMPTPDVLKRLSEQFDLCVYGLGEVRRQWEQQSGDADAPLLLG